MKLTICIVLLAIVAASLAQSHNMQWGVKQNGDRQLYRDIKMKKGSLLQIKEEDVSINTAAKINFISAVDQYADDNGGKAMLTDGGVGFNSVNMHLKSKRGHGYNFIIEIWGQ